MEVTLKSGEEKVLYTTDITVAEQALRDAGYDPLVHDIPHENWFLNYVLPILLVVIVGVFVFVMINNQNAAGGNGGKMMNFGKSRAKLSMGDHHVTLKDVAGLKGKGGGRRGGCAFLQYFRF